MQFCDISDISMSLLDIVSTSDNDRGRMVISAGNSNQLLVFELALEKVNQ